ncbi:T-cell surface glycoprotein CD8 beta chain [Rattus rattus]|uniref:T-cell surface glycoprotein CD8 beta chain n=1 Tax=Rattus rattus TaxID=10117 RepID=UPI0013F2D715|nr:T-cell surface glycoprotein CD8 beta chain [Rattus rattus]
MRPWLWLLFSVKLAALWGSSALLQTPASLLVQTNQTAKMSCEAKTFPKGTTIYWLRELQDSNKNKHFEFLASGTSTKGIKYGERVKKNVTLSFNSTLPFLKITDVKPEDSGFYFCAMVGSPMVVFGTGTKLTVVDVLPTTAPTKKTTLKKKQCPTPHTKTQKGLTCGLITLSLLVACILVLLVSLSVAIHFHCMRRRARIRFMKQFHK